MRKNRKLTKFEENFVQELIKGKTQRQAYKDAGYKCDKMSDDIIDRKASIVFGRDVVRARYDELHQRVIQEAEDECIITAKEVLRELKSIAMDDISNYLDFRTMKTIVGYDEEDGEPIVDWRTLVDIKDSTTINTKNIQEVSIGRDGQFKFKLYSRDNALEKLGKHLKLFVDRIEAEVDSEIIVKMEGYEDDWSK